jgi:uncharacterized membrane protein
MRFCFTVTLLAAFALASSPAWGQTSPAPEATPTATPGTTMMAPLAPTTGPTPLQTITLEACNGIKFPIFLAVAYPDGNSETSRGWQFIEPDKCVTVGPFPLNRKRFSFYAFGDRGRKDWVGDSNFCVNTRASFKYENAARAVEGSLCPDQGPTRKFISVTPARLFPNDPDKRDTPALKFKFNFN